MRTLKKNKNPGSYIERFGCFCNEITKPILFYNMYLTLYLTMLVSRNQHKILTAN